MSRNFDINKRYKFIGFKFNYDDNEDKIICDFDKKYLTHNYSNSYKYLVNEPLKFVETYQNYHYFKREEQQNNNEIAFIFPDEIAFENGHQLSDSWFPVIIEIL
tara:strand:+ start:545 stop:856 length:312 start_codon:yes stop_codon:yes gene_type:complete